RLAVSGLISFSDAPLRLALWLGLLVSTTAIIYGIYVFIDRLLAQQYVAGWASTMFVVAFLGGANMMLTGIMGLYVGRIYSEVKRRPLYIVARSRGFERTRASADDPSATSRVGPMRGAL
ncbi:MAG: dolichol-phosphate mannosyltransferase, partial [Verrucomicrobia bacterium]